MFDQVGFGTEGTAACGAGVSADGGSGRWVYAFGPGFAEGGGDLVDELGGKGAGLAEMARLGVPVPPGFTIAAAACRHHLKAGGFPPGLMERVDAALRRLEREAGARFGDPRNPLLVAVRSGARASMPGMMDTVLNLGLNDATVEGLAARTGDVRFAYDCYRRLIQSYAPLVLGVGAHRFDALLDSYKEERGLVQDGDLGAEDWRRVVTLYQEEVSRRTGRAFPQDPAEQLHEAIGAVFRSWMNPRAVAYRALHGIPDDWGTAATVQSMVFGNRGGESGTGVAFTRDPSSGEPGLCGEFLANAQGEDVVAGIRTPSPLAALRDRQPATFARLRALAERLERHFGDMQDIEFTVQNGDLFILQTRTGKRSAAAAVRIAVDLVDEGVITPDAAVQRVDPAILADLLRPVLDPEAERTLLAQGLPASPGAACGAVAFTAEDAVRLGAGGAAVILCRPETSPEDIVGMQAACGIVTTRGGFTSHAATVARGMGRPCVVSARGLRIDLARGEMATAAGPILRAGDVVTIDGSTGQVALGAVPMVRPEPSGPATRLLAWAADAGVVV
ncbi:pyruvate, phosphate dikinase [Azospirillum soli]|uniref:pyruvate, phosphate dikinase n=1 Tax=Azospirillum soli TaxID=1304799 RepID=UPI001AE7F888|nr:pyruvate, phosphate dikinase [Azospirillum soli]MBP2314707.1 pyruvate,orthophosphate dikinase [Azospirillum soli]